MRYHLLVSTIIALLLVSTVSAIWSPTVAVRKRLPRPLASVPHLRHEQRLQGNRKLQDWLQNQQPTMNNFLNTVFPSSTASNKDSSGPFSRKGGPVISDVLPKARGVNIFASLTRDFESVSSRLDDASSNVTVLAPRNSAIMGLPHKPWENPEDYEQHGEMKAYAGQEGHDRAKSNLERFVKAHIIPTSPWETDEEVETLGGQKLKWSKDGDKIIVRWVTYSYNHNVTY